MSDDVEDFLAHFGVKGMKWGVRQAQQASGRPTVTQTNAGKLTNPMLKYGGYLLEKDRLNFEKKALTAAHKELKKDPDPTNLDKGANPSDTFNGDGFTFNGTNYAKYASDKAYYYKYDTGEKSFAILNGSPDSLQMHMDAGGNLIPETKLIARDSSVSFFDDDVTHTALTRAETLIHQHANVTLAQINNKEVNYGSG